LAQLQNGDPRYPMLLKKEQALWLKWMHSEINARGIASKPL
jgi:hypothetical protein